MVSWPQYSPLIGCHQVSVALVICLNVGVDPPDVTKTVPCARQECWVDPLSLNTQRALETIGANLQRQYERWQPRARSVGCSREQGRCHLMNRQ